MQFDGVIFDLDGTLADTLEDIAAAMNRVLRARQLPGHSLAWYRGAVGGGIRRLVGDALPPEERTDEAIAGCLAEMMADYREHCLVATHLYDGIEELLSELKAGGVKMAVFSNKADELTRRIVNALIGADTFAVVIGAQPGLPLKPDPAAALLIGSHFGIPAARIVYVGDTGIDVRTASAAGMMPVGVSWGFRARAELLESGATVVLDHPLELLEIRG